MIEDKNKIQKKSNAYLQYSGIAFQMAGLVAISFFLGRWVDNKVGNEKPYIGMIFLIVVFVSYMYKLYRELFQEGKK